jgi:rubredoxin
MKKEGDKKMTFTHLTDLPDRWICRLCAETKPISELIIVHDRKAQSA